MSLILIFLSIILGSCSKPDNKPTSTTSPLAEVQAKRDRYIEYAKKTLDGWDWLAPECDGLLFNALAAYSGFPVNVYRAEETPGRWRRHPNFERCKPYNGSASTISKDMFRGLFLYLLQQSDFAAIRRIKSYCDNHEILAGTSCAMGEAKDTETYYGRVVFNPVQRHQIARMLKKNLVTNETRKDDFEAHLDVLRIYTDYKIDGGISDEDVKAIKGYAESSPRNALFQILWHKFSDGDQSAAISILMDDVLFPNSRLPNDTDRYTHYIWQRDPNEDWQPCGTSDRRPCEGVTHSGVDLMFAVRLLEE